MRVPFDYSEFVYEHQHFTLAEMGFAMSLTMRLWVAPGNRVRPVEARIMADGLADKEPGLSDKQFAEVMDCAFWADSQWVYSPWVQKWNGRSMPRQPISRETRDTVIKRDTFFGRWKMKCSYCGGYCEDRFHLDHMLPVSRGGINHHNNLCIACPTCNFSKGAMTDEEFRETIEE